MKRADLGLWADPCLLREEYLGPCLALLPSPPRKMLEGHHAPCPEQPFSPGGNTARVNKPSMCKASKPVKPGCWRLLSASGIRIPNWSRASPLWKRSWPPLLLSPWSPFFSSLQVSSPAHAWAALLRRDTHTHTPKERISELNHLSKFSRFPAQPGSEWETNFCHGLPSESARSEAQGQRAAGLGSRERGCACESAEESLWQGCMLRLSTAAARCLSSSTAPAAVLLCNHITADSISPSLRRDTLDSAKHSGEQGRAHRVPGPLESSAGDRSGGGEGEEWRCKDGHAREEEEEETKYTWRGGKKREEGRCTNTQKAPWSDLWRPDTGCWAQTRFSLLADISHRLSGLASLILG